MERALCIFKHNDNGYKCSGKVYYDQFLYGLLPCFLKESITGVYHFRKTVLDVSEYIMVS